MTRQPLEIRTCESASNDQLANNVLENMELIPEWIKDSYKPHDGHALMISAGHSWTKDPKGALGKITNLHRMKSFAVKHALPYFEKTDYRPDYCVALDPRPLEGTSTLGHERKGLYKIFPETTYLIASMTHPSVTKFLLDSGAKVVGWHSACAGMEDPRVQAKKIRNWIVGGSCSAMRGINVARVFGFREVSMLGYDSSFDLDESIYHLIKKRSPELTQALGIVESNGLLIDFQKIMEDKQKAIAPPPEHAKMLEYLAGKGYEVAPPQQLKGSEIILPVVVGDFKSHISPELAAQVKDIEAFFQGNQDLIIHNLSGGFCKALFDAMGGEEALNPHNFTEGK